MTSADAGALYAPHARSSHNVADLERIASVAIGSALIGLGLRRRDAGGIAAALIGGVLLHRGATGNCSVYRMLGVATGDSDAVLDAPMRHGLSGRAATVNARKAIKVQRSVMIDVPRAVLFAFWQDLTNLPRFMEHLVAVRIDSPTRSHWEAKGPAGQTVEWEAELVNVVQDEIIAWKTVGHPDVANAGAVNFRDAPGGRGTIVKVTLDYEPPAGRIGNLFARLFGEDPDRQVREDLQKFKQLMEVGESTTSSTKVVMRP